MKKQIKLSRIHCAGCAEALEQKINEIEEIESASIDFSTKTIIYETEHNHGKEKEVREKIIGVVKKFDHTIQIVEDKEEKKSGGKGLGSNRSNLGRSRISQNPAIILGGIREGTASVKKERAPIKIFLKRRKIFYISSLSLTKAG